MSSSQDTASLEDLTETGRRSENEDATRLRDVIARLHGGYEGKADELIPMLQEVQRALGYLPEEALSEIANRTGTPASTVFGVATFYSQFRLEPIGRHIVKVCTGTACHVRGSAGILKHIGKCIDIEPGQTTEDRLFTLETVACFGSCALAPVVVVDEVVSGRMNAAKVKNALDNLALVEIWQRLEVVGLRTAR